MFKERFFIYQEKGDFEAEKLKKIDTIDIQKNRFKLKEQAAKEITKEKVSWKYADAEKAKNLKAENPNDKLKNKEIEDSAHNVSWMEEWQETPIDDQWKNKKFRDAIVKNILENRVSWKYADAEQAANLKAENPNDKLQDNEIEKAAYNVSWMEEWKGTELDDQWKDKKFRDAIVKNVLENRAKKKEDAKIRVEKLKDKLKDRNY